MRVSRVLPRFRHRSTRAHREATTARHHRSAAVGRAEPASPEPRCTTPPSPAARERRRGAIAPLAARASSSPPPSTFIPRRRLPTTCNHTRDARRARRRRSAATAVAAVGAAAGGLVIELDGRRGLARVCPHDLAHALRARAEGALDLWSKRRDGAGGRWEETRRRRRAERTEGGETHGT